MVGEGDAKTMGAQAPIEWMSAWGEGMQEGDVVCEGRKLDGTNGREASVIERAGPVLDLIEHNSRR